jgi:hypothetical protein
LVLPTQADFVVCTAWSGIDCPGQSVLLALEPERSVSMWQFSIGP